MDHSRPPRIACALGKRRATDQFFVSAFRGAHLRNAHVSRGGGNHYGVISGGDEATKERHQENRGIGCCTSYGGCALARSGIALGVFPHALVVCDDHRGLCSKCTADRPYLLPDASVAPAHRRRQDAYFHCIERWQVTRHDAFLYSAALIFGLALGVHHVTVALTLPAVAVIVFRTQGVRFFTSRRLVYAALISIGALVAVYAYLPLAASRSPVINWGHPRSLQEIWWHLTGRQYQVYFSFKPEIMGEQFAEFCRMALREFGFPWLPLSLVLAFAGLADAFKRDRTIFWFLLTIVIADLAYALSYEIAEDKDAYYLPTFISIAIAAGLGIRWLIRSAVSKSLPVAKPSLAAVVAVLVVSTIALTANWPFNNRRQYFIAHDYVDNLLKAIAPNGLLLTLDWQVVSPMFYAQEIEKLRPDVKVVDINLLRRSWYFDYLNHAYPALIERSREKIDVFVENLKEWERDPGAFARSPALTQRISAAFLEMIQSMVTNESTVAPVYMTNDLISSDSVNGELTRWLTQKYQLIPQGLVFNLADGQGFHDSPDVHLQIRGLADGTLRFGKGDPVNVKVLPTYANMLINRGRYLALFGQHERAIGAFEQALALNPNLTLARQGLAESAAKARRP